MTTEKLMDAIGLLPGDLVTQADQWRTTRKTRVIHWKRWAAMAACLVLVLGAALAVSNLGRSMEKGASMAEPQAPGAPAMDTASPEILEESALMDTPSEEKQAVNGAGELTWPPALILSWEGGTVEVWPGNYELRTENPDGTRNETIACGPYPPDANLEPVKAAAQVELIWPEIPDSVTVRCWKDTGEEGTGEMLEGVLTVNPEYPIYEITAVWGETCTASYAVRLRLN